MTVPKPQPEFLPPFGRETVLRARGLTKTEEKETIVINRSGRSTYPDEKPVLRNGATPHLVPDEIVAEAVRRRYQLQFTQTWDRDFISNEGFTKGKVASTILAELYLLWGDAYMKVGRRTEAKADYDRVKSDAWNAEERYHPRNIYFTKSGIRDYELPESWPPVPPVK
jgi:hypothetical protein